MFDPDGFRDPVVADNPPDDAQSRFSTGNEVSQAMRSKRATRTQDMDRFEQAGLSTAVRTNEEIDSGGEFKLDSFQDPEASNFDGEDTHDGEYRRPIQVRPLMQPYAL